MRERGRRTGWEKEKEGRGKKGVRKGRQKESSKR